MTSAITCDSATWCGGVRASQGLGRSRVSRAGSNAVYKVLFYFSHLLRGALYTELTKPLFVFTVVGLP